MAKGKKKERRTLSPTALVEERIGITTFFIGRGRPVARAGKKKEKKKGRGKRERRSTAISAPPVPKKKRTNRCCPQNLSEKIGRRVRIRGNTKTMTNALASTRRIKKVVLSANDG